MNIQYVIVIVLILAASVYLFRYILNSAKGHSCESGKCGCGKPTNKVS
jgi:hypothetical protein